MAEELVTPVEATRVSALQPFHPGDQIGLRRLDHHMKMIRHEDIGVNLPARLGASLAQRVDEALAIRIIHEDPFAPVTAIHDVINRANLFDSQLAGRAGRVALAALCINIKNRPLFLNHPMKVIRHEDIGVNQPARLGASFAQRVDEALAIRIIHEDPFAPVTAIHDVINRANLFDSQLAGHARRVTLAALHINIKN